MVRQLSDRPFADGKQKSANEPAVDHFKTAGEGTGMFSILNGTR
jgi:hypothetical protein